MTRHAHAAQRPAPNEPLTAGPRWYRARIRILGPVLGLAPMALLGLVAIVALEVGDGRTSGLLGLASGVSAAPGLLVAGAPLADESRYPLAIAGSGVLWLALGFLASRRATRPAVASWRDYWRELFWLTISVVVGALAALLAATTILSESLIF